MNNSESIKYRLPKLSYVNRDREYRLYPERLRDAVVYEYLFKGMSHRWIDENILGLDVDYSRGYQAMGILHYLGLKSDFKGIFKDTNEIEAIEIMKNQDEKGFNVISNSIFRYVNNLYSDDTIDMFIIRENSVFFTKQVGTLQYTDGVRIEKEFHQILNPPKSPFYVERGQARKIKILFNNKIFDAEYRYENQTRKDIELQSIRFRKDLKEEFKKVFPVPEGQFTIQVGADLNHFIFNHLVEVDNIDNEDEAEEYPEGKRAYRTHRIIERNQKVIKEAKKQFALKHDGRLFCEACKFDFTKVYGDRGKDFIEGHHKKLVSQMKAAEKTKVEDIAMLCSNCHRMIHKKPLLSVDKLAELIIKN